MTQLQIEIGHDGEYLGCKQGETKQNGKKGLAHIKKCYSNKKTGLKPEQEHIEIMKILVDWFARQIGMGNIQKIMGRNCNKTIIILALQSQFGVFCHLIYFACWIITLLGFFFIFIYQLYSYHSLDFFFHFLSILFQGFHYFTFQPLVQLFGQFGLDINYWILKVFQIYLRQLIQSSKLTSILKMRKRNSMSSNYQHCSICSPVDDQVSCINNSLLKQIRQAIDLLKDSYDQQSPKLESLDFSRFLKMIYGKKFKNLKTTLCCKHTQLKRIFMSQLKCSEKQIDKVSGFLSWKMAKRSFHTDVIISQSKSFLRHFIQPEQKSSQISPISQSVRRQKEQSEQKPVKQEHEDREIFKNKVQNQMLMNQMPCQIMSNHMQPNFEHFSIYYPMTWHPTHLIFPNQEIEPQQEDKNENSQQNILPERRRKR